jgi:hypothetical protein
MLDIARVHSAKEIRGEPLSDGGECVDYRNAWAPSVLCKGRILPAA